MFVCFPVHFLLVILYDLCAAFGIISDEFLWTILCRRLHVINILGRLIFTDIVRMYSAGAVLGNFFFLGGGAGPLNFPSHLFSPSFPLPPALLSFFMIPSFPSLSPFPSLPFPPFRSRPLKSSEGVWGSAVSSPSGVWGGAPTEIEFGAF